MIQSVYFRLFILTFTLFHFQAHLLAQEIEIVDSKEVLENAFQLLSAEKFDESIQELSKIGRNDSNYALALEEISVLAFQEKQYEKAYETALKGLSIKSKFEGSFYNTAGIASKNLQKFEEAERLLLSGLKKYPNNYLLYYNLGLLYEKQRKMELAIKNYQNSVVSNPFYSNSHFRLGRIYAINEKPVQAMMAIQMSLILDPESKKSIDILSALEATVNNLMPPADSDKVDLPGDGFGDIELLIKSKISLNKNYKSKTKINSILARQTQLLLEKIIFDVNDKDFFMQFYVPFYIKLSKQGYLAPMVYLSYASVEDSDIRKTVIKNKAGIKEFYDWMVKELASERKSRALVNEDATRKYLHFYYDHNELKALGKFKDAAETVQIGEWFFYYSNGILSGKESYDDNGLPMGEWWYYYDTGELKGYKVFSNGKANGISYGCFSNGVKELEINFVDDVPQGDLKYYYPSGQLKKIVSLIDNERSGLELYYYPSGAKESEGNCIQGKREGEFRLFYESGELKEIITFLHDENDGIEKEFYRSGQLMKEGVNKANKPIGKWSYYHKNAKIWKTGSFTQEGLLTGIWKEFYDNGVLEKEYAYDEKGLLNGEYKDYDKSGKLTLVSYFEKDILKGYKCYDLQGKVISEGKESKGHLKFIGLNPDGTKYSSGEYQKGQMSGEWIFYDRNGSVEFKDNYVNGKLDGIRIEYYSNGLVYSEMNYKNGKLNGIGKTYFINSKLASKGLFEDGLRTGDWYEYYATGNLKNHEFYEAGDPEGYWVMYYENGKINYEDYYQNGLLINETFYDTLGKKYQDVSLKNGSGEYQVFFPNNKPWIKGKYVNGLTDGEFTWFYPNGTIESKGAYIHGKRNDEFVNYYENGNLASKRKYKFGISEGLWKWYHENGQLSRIGNYKDGRTDSVWVYYHEDGKKDFVSENHEGYRNGYAYYYNANEELLCRKKYDEGKFVSYSYLGENKQMVAEIPIENETVALVGYFPNGKKAMEENIVKGRYEGKRIFYFSNGQIEKEYNFKGNLQEGESIQFDINGKILSKENYFYDELHGAAQYFGNNGKLVMEGSYVLGDKHGAWKYYDVSGKLLKTVIYWYGQPYGEK